MLIALIVSACSSQRKVTRESRDRVATYEQKDSVKKQVMVAVHDTIMEVTTITVREAANGDTLRVSTVTDRLRGRSRDSIAVQKTKTEVRDTVYIERKDSVQVQDSRFMVSGPEKRGATLVSALKWVFWIIVSLTVLIVVFKLTRRF